MSISPEKALCFQDAKVPFDLENETSCILIRDQLAREMGVKTCMMPMYEVSPPSWVKDADSVSYTHLTLPTNREV